MMKKVKIALLGVLFLGMTSCATMFENMNCEEDRTNPDNCENFEFNLDSNCE